MAAEDLTLRMRAVGARAASRDVERTSRSIQKVGRAAHTADKRMAHASRSARLFHGGLHKLTHLATHAGAALGIVGIAGGAEQAIEKFREVQKVTNDTTAAIKSIGAETWVSSEAVHKMSEELALKTGFDNVVIQRGQNLLLTFSKVRNEAGKGADIFNRASAAAIDMSARGFGSVTSTSKQLGKALQDPIKGITALRRSGVTFTASQQKTIKHLVATNHLLDAQKLIMKEVERQVKGSAAAQADPIDKLRVAWNLLMEKLGAGLWPVITKLIGGFSLFVGGIQEGTGAGGAFADTMTRAWHAVRDVWNAGKDLVKGYKDNKLWADIVVGALSALVLGFVAYKTAVKAVAIWTGVASFATGGWVTSFWALNAAMTANPMFLVIAALAVLGVAIFVAYRKFAWFRNAVHNVWEALKTVFNWAKDNWPLILAILTGPFGLAVLIIKKNFGTIIGFVEDRINNVIDVINFAIKAFNKLPLHKDIGLIGHVGSPGKPAGGGAGGRTAGGDSGTAGHRARGGAIHRPGIYEVGERGRERVFLPAGAAVEPHGGFGGEIVVPVTLTMDGRAVAHTVVRHAMKKKSTS